MSDSSVPNWPDDLWEQVGRVADDILAMPAASSAGDLEDRLADIARRDEEEMDPVEEEILTEAFWRMVSEEADHVMSMPISVERLESMFSSSGQSSPSELEARALSKEDSFRDEGVFVGITPVALRESCSPSRHRQASVCRTRLRSQFRLSTGRVGSALLVVCLLLALFGVPAFDVESVSSVSIGADNLDDPIITLSESLEHIERLESELPVEVEILFDRIVEDQIAFQPEMFGVEQYRGADGWRSIGAVNEVETDGGLNSLLLVGSPEFQPTLNNASPDIPFVVAVVSDACGRASVSLIDEESGVLAATGEMEDTNANRCSDPLVHRSFAGGERLYSFNLHDLDLNDRILPGREYSLKIEIEHELWTGTSISKSEEFMFSFGPSSLDETGWYAKNYPNRYTGNALASVLGLAAVVGVAAIKFDTHSLGLASKLWRAIVGKSRFTVVKVKDNYLSKFDAGQSLIDRA